MSIGKLIDVFSDSIPIEFFFSAIAFCEKNFAGKIGNANQLETQLDRLFVAQITHELNAYLEAMEKTR